MGSVKKPTISIDATLYEAVNAAAGEAGMSFSAWLSEAARTQLRHESLAAAIADYEAEHGAFSETELAATTVAQAVDQANATGTEPAAKRRQVS